MSNWIDSRNLKPADGQTVWNTLGPEEEVHASIFDGSGGGQIWRRDGGGYCNCYFWQPREVPVQPVKPERMAPLPTVRTDGWINSREQLPPLGAYLWIVKESSSLVQFAQSLQVPSPNGHPHFNKFITDGQLISFYGHRLWRLAKSPDAPKL